MLMAVCLESKKKASGVDLNLDFENDHILECLESPQPEFVYIGIEILLSCLDSAEHFDLFGLLDQLSSVEKLLPIFEIFMNETNAARIRAMEGFEGFLDD